MPITNSRSPLSLTISQIEWALDRMQPANEHEARLRLKIEEAMEIGYEAIYARSARNSNHLALVFSAR